MPPRRIGRLATALAVAAAVGLVSSSAAALDPQPHSFGVGLVLAAGVNWIDQPADQTVTVGDQSGQPASIGEYPGFAGPRYGFGLALDARLFGWVGVELDIIRSRDLGRAHFTAHRDHGEETFTLEIAQDAWHVPLLLKGTLPTQHARPLIFLGPEFVFPERGMAEIEHGFNLFDAEFAAHTESYLMLTWGGGAEIDLPIDEVDVRLAASARGSVTPGVADERVDRASYVGRDIHRLRTVSYKTTWQFQLVGTLAASIHF